MTATIDTLLDDDPIKWIQALPKYQSDVIECLLANGFSFDDVAQSWISVSAENISRFAAKKPPAGKDGEFLENMRKEIRAFLCGGMRYEKERDGLFGKGEVTQTYVVSTLAVAIAPYLNVTSVFISPVIALLLASIGKVTLNAWCATQNDAQSIGQPDTAP